MICNHICEECELNNDNCMMDDAEEEELNPIEND